MNEVLPDWATNPYDPNSVVCNDEANIRLTRKNHELQAEIDRLKAENAELRMRHMTRAERIQQASAEDLVKMLNRIYVTGICDGRQGEPYTYKNFGEFSDWLQGVGEI